MTFCSFFFAWSLCVRSGVSSVPCLPRFATCRCCAPAAHLHFACGKGWAGVGGATTGWRWGESVLACKSSHTSLLPHVCDFKRASPRQRLNSRCAQEGGEYAPLPHAGAQRGGEAMSPPCCGMHPDVEAVFPQCGSVRRGGEAFHVPCAWVHKGGVAVTLCVFICLVLGTTSLRRVLCAKGWGLGWQGLCSQSANLWATANCLPR